MSAAVVVVRQQDESKEKEDPLEDIAVQFFQLMHQRKNPQIKTRAPGRIETDAHGKGTTQASAGATGENGAPERAKLVSFEERCPILREVGCVPPILIKVSKKLKDGKRLKPCSCLSSLVKM